MIYNEEDADGRARVTTDEESYYCNFLVSLSLGKINYKTFSNSLVAVANEN